MLLEKDEIANTLSNEEIQKYNAKLNKSAYIKEGNISVKSRFNSINPITIHISERGNNTEKCKNIFTNFNYGDNNATDATIIEDDNYFLIKSDLISAEYIGFRNENLRELCRMLGVTNTDYIPNKIKAVDYAALFSASDGEKNHILGKYVPICRKFVNNKDYTKRVDVKLNSEKCNITAYEVKVSDAQLNNLAINILKELYEDNETLQFISRKIKILDDESPYSDISFLKHKINELVQYFENMEIKNENILSIIIYKNEKNVEKVEFVIENDRTISVEIEDGNKLKIAQYDVEHKSFNLNTSNGFFMAMLNSISEITYSKSVLDEDTSTVDVNVVCNIGLETVAINYNYIQQIKDNIGKLIHKNEIDYTDLKELDMLCETFETFGDGLSLFQK